MVERMVGPCDMLVSMPTKASSDRIAAGSQRIEVPHVDRKLIHSHFSELQADLERRHAPEDMRTGLNRLAAAITRRRELQGETDDLRSQRNTLSKQIGPLMKFKRSSGCRTAQGPSQNHW